MKARHRDSARKPEVCAHPDCTCELGDDRIEYRGKSYCCRECAQGSGCDHADCLCGVTRRG
jgi:hypothetical protein